ncbi:TPA: hypothetical protein U0833_001598 [Streptococcus suis]|nr:hypothetical protein [Streptococcus suis]
MKQNLEERMLVTVTVNLMHRMEEFQEFKKEQAISGDYEAKIAYLVEKFRVHEKTAENLLSGNVVSKNNYLQLFPSFDHEVQHSVGTEIERLTETISEEIEQGNEDTIKEVNDIITNKLEKLDLKKQVKNYSLPRLTSLEEFVNSSFRMVNKPRKGIKISDYALIIWINYFYTYISKQDNLFEITSKLDTLSQALEYLPLIEKIFESEESLYVFIELANRLDYLKFVEKRDEWDLFNELLISIKNNHGFDDYL